MTAAIDKAIKLSIHLMEAYPYLKSDVQTDSVPAILQKEGNLELKQRSALHITLTKARNNE